MLATPYQPVVLVAMAREGTLATETDGQKYVRLLPKIVKQWYSDGFLAEPFHSYIDIIKIVVSTCVGWCFFCRCCG